MKKYFALLPALLLTLGIASCNSSGTEEFHQTTFLPVNSGGRILYADQSIDSLGVFSYDSWTLKAKGEGADWFAVSPTQHTIPAGHVSTQRILLTASPNTSGKTRTGEILLTTTYPKFPTLAMPVRQVAWHNVTYPRGVQHVGPDQKISDPVFALNIPAEKNTTKAAFRLYDDDATGYALVSDAAWLVVKLPAAGLKKGANTIDLEAADNLSSTPRTAQLKLTSAGVTTVISYTQRGKTK